MRQLRALLEEERGVLGLHQLDVHCYWYNTHRAIARCTLSSLHALSVPFCAFDLSEEPTPALLTRQHAGSITLNLNAAQALLIVCDM